ncbi:RidA family protein [Xanthobacter sp. DSM 24535]|uniref:RidA family protein n=1 Tax=Roseixanthobacter psychrophilus TaxID=3119917 RepID=UPI00372C13DF
MSTVRKRLEDAGFLLPPPPAPNGLYRSVILHGGFAFVSGQLSRFEGGVIEGPIEGLAEDQAAFAARAAALRALAALDDALGSLDRITNVIRMTGFVHAGPGFRGHSLIIDHASELLRIGFLEKGEHARSAIGVSSLPSGGCVELELTVAF